MHVCLLNDSFPPVIDGVVNVVENYASYLSRDHQAEVMVGTPGYPDADYSQFEYPVVPYRSFNTAAVTSGYRTGNPFTSRAIARMAAFRPDVIHTHCPASSTVIARLLREDTGAPVVFTYHTKYDIDIRRVVKLMPLAQEGIRLMVKNIEACDDVWVVSRGAGDNLRSLGYEGEFQVMTNGVDFEKGRVAPDKVREVVEGYDLPEDVPVYLFVGRLMTYKGLPLLLDALRIVKDSGQPFRMVFVGKGPDREKLMQQAEDLGLMEEGRELCIFTGPIYDREVLRAWNTRADLFLFPSTFDTNGLVVREAAACGLASVLIDGSCAAEGVTDGRNGFLIEETSEAMAALLCELGSDLARMHQAGEHAMNEIYVSWKECVDAAYERYQVVLEEKKSGYLPVRKKKASDFLLSMTAISMSEEDRIRQISENWFRNVKASAYGMMENIQEAEEELTQIGEKIKNRLLK